MKWKSRIVGSNSRDYELSKFVPGLQDASHPISQRLGQFKEKRFTIKDTDLTYRTLNHWVSEGLIDDERNNEGQGWRKFSIYDRLWVQIILELRKYGISFEKIKSVKECLFFKNDIGDNRPFTWFEFGIIRSLVNCPPKLQ